MESPCQNNTATTTTINLNASPSRRHDEDDDGVPPDEVLLMEELHRLRRERKILTEKLSRVTHSFNAVQNHLNQILLNNNHNNSGLQSRKRKAHEEIIHNNNCNNNRFNFSGADEDNSILLLKRHNKDQSFPISPPKVKKVLVRIHASDPSLYVSDGYQWRKYGQKVTRDNPSPRAYFRCSFAPTCPVKKKVQKSAEDPTLLVATYEGEHNHIAHGAQVSFGVTHQSDHEVINPIIIRAKSSSSGGFINNNSVIIDQFLVQKMASSLTKDPTFTSALATAISGRLLDHSVP